MRLLNAKTLEITEFVDADNTPPYVILSHRWREGEVLFHHMDNPAEAEKLYGFSKLRKCCEKVLQEDFDWVWIDTCCIDKTSSSELSEAINSMFSWYRKSEVCYAYLDDVEKSSFSVAEDILGSEWFRRGWTLQELIAPQEVVFFAKDWSEMGTRRSLVVGISRITLVDPNVLLGLKLPLELGVAQRMLWASRRKTTRVEDMSYCLMGLFDVHMPTIYGEGKQAFIRLQHEIMRSTTDHSVFAWRSWDVLEDAQDVLAPHPDRFQGGLFGVDIIRPMPYTDFARRFGMKSYSPEYTATNHGIRIRLPIKEITLQNGEHEYTAALACHIGDKIIFGLRLQPVEGTTDQYCRVGDLVRISNLDPESFTIKDLYLAYRNRSRALRVPTGVSIKLLQVDMPCRYSPRCLHPHRRWAVGTRGELSLKVANVRAGWHYAVAMLQQDNEHGNEKIGVVFGVDYTEDHEPHCIRASLIIDDGGEGAWSTISPSPAVLCTSSSDQEAASLIWRKYQYEHPYSKWDLYIDLQSTRLRRFHQISLERGSRVVHLTTDTYMHPGTNEWILDARVVSHPPSYSGWNLVWFLGSILGHIPTFNLKIRVWSDIGSSLAVHQSKQIIASAFLFEETDWMREIPEAMFFKIRAASELWRTYFENVCVRTNRSNNADSDGHIAVYRFGTVKVLEDDFLGVAAHFEAAIISAWEVPAPPSIQAIIEA